MGVSGGSVSNMIQTLYGKPIHNAVATSAGLGVPITIAGTIGLMIAGWPQQALLPPFSIGFVSLLGVAIMAPVSSFTAPYGARLAHRLSKRQLEIGFGLFLLLVSVRFVASLLVKLTDSRASPACRRAPPSFRSRLRKLMPSRLTRSCPGCAISAGTARSTMPPTARRSSVTGGGAGAAVGGVDIDGIGQHFERQARGLGGLLGQHDRARAGVEHHGDARAVDLRRHLEVAAAAAHDLDGALAAHAARARASARPARGRPTSRSSAR